MWSPALIRYNETQGPNWSDRTFEVFDNQARLFVIGCKVQSLIEKKLYIGIDEVIPLSFSQLRKLRGLFAHAFAGWKVTALVEEQNTTGLAFARFFKLTQTGRVAGVITFERDC